MKTEQVNRKRMSINTRILLGVCFCIVLIVVTGLLSQKLSFARNGVHVISDPVQKSFSDFKEWIYDHSKGMDTLNEVLEENQRLRDQISILEEENRALQSQARRTQELEELYALDTYYRDYPKIGAQIIGMSPSNWYESFMIDAGSENGLDLYMPVLYSSGLAGHISEVEEHYATVTTIVSQESVIYGQINRQGGDLVVVKGALGYRSNELGVIEDELCMITFKSNETDISLGDEIVTSTLGDIYPPGLSIGTVTEIIPLGNGFDCIALVRPTADLDTMDMVLVITELWNNGPVTDEATEGGSVE